MGNYYKDNKELKHYLTHPLMEKIVRLKEQDFRDSGKFDYATCTADDTIDSYDKVLEIMGEICADVISQNAE
ncbi:MAG: acyl-CoA dehydrogenase, partial [Bacteroidales bacterium]|nr:acyl-CoA dehydrogenase [Bacteroidales bacterium]